MHPYLRLVRAGNVLVSFAGTIVGGLAAAGRGLGISELLGLYLVLAAASTACVTAAGNVLNDVLDLESDRVNHPDRPLVTGAILAARARLLVVGLFVAAGALAAPVIVAEPLVGVILLLAVGALLAYEFRFKSAGFVGNHVVAFLTAAVFLYGGAAAGAIGPVLAFAALAYLATLSREVIKDMEDVAGDVGRTTLPKTQGMRTASAVARVSVGLAIVLSPLPALTFLSGHAIPEIAYLAIVGLADVVFVASALWLPERLHREQTLSKGAMSIALVAFLAAAFR